MVKHRGRPRKRGRPKGSRNKKSFHFPEPSKVTEIINRVEPIDTKSRLDECMTKLETAVFEAIEKLKASI